jgi:two-component system chemotaxis response regulator CheB
MPAQFTGVFAARLDRYSSVTVKHAEDGDLLIPDRVLIAPGGMQLVLKGTPQHARVTLTADPPVSGFRPSIDVLFRSAAKVYGRAAVGLLMTGMGRDGVDGCKAILAAGGLTLGQDEDSSVVYGMNKAAYLEGAIKAQFALDDVSDIIQNMCAFRASLEEHPAPDHGHGESSSEDKPS